MLEVRGAILRSPVEAQNVLIRWNEDCTKMDALPEVLRVVISEALTSRKKLSWSVWDNGEITSVKQLWKPEVVDAPIRSEIPLHGEKLPSGKDKFGLHVGTFHGISIHTHMHVHRTHTHSLLSFLTPI